jgi:hypothetical protein
MGRALTLLHDAFVEIQSDGSLLLEQDFIMNIFSRFTKRFPRSNNTSIIILKSKRGM